MELNIAVLPGDGIGPEISVQGVALNNRFRIKRFNYRHAINFCINTIITQDLCSLADF